MAAKLVILSSQSQTLVNFRYHMLCDFLSAGLSVHALAPLDSYFEKTQKKLSEKGITLEAIALNNTGLNPLKDLALFCRLVSYFRKKKPDIAFFYTIKPVIFGCLAAKFSKVPKTYAMVSGLGYAFMGKSYKRRMLRFLTTHLYKRALHGVNKVFFHNQDDANLFLQLRLVKPTQIVITDGSGIDTDYFSPEPYPEQLTFIFVGRLIRDKGINEFVAAAQEIKRKHPEVRFLVAGGLHQNPTSLSRAALDSLIHEGFIEYLGELTDIRKGFEQASVLVLPSYREGLPRAALEALAMARPVITTDAPGCREVVQENSNGFLVPVENVEALVAAIRYYIDHPEAIAIMGAAGRQLAESRFAISKVNQTILKAMELPSLHNKCV